MSVRRTIGSLLLAAFVAAMVLGNFYGTPVARWLHAITLDQPWDVFAPDPVQAHGELDALVHFEDGTHEVWRPPRADPLLAASTYHWDMWTRYVVAGQPGPAWATAHWVGERYRDHRPRAVAVTLRRWWFELPPPGSDRPRLWNGADFYRLRLDQR